MTVITHTSGRSMLVSPDLKGTDIMEEEKNWYRKRSYAHFDKPMSESKAYELVSNPERVARHAFWPVILNPQKTISLAASNGQRVHTAKYRPIAFSAHSDSHIYAYYAALLSQYLEDRYTETSGNHVLAYRKFEPPQCNIHFAYAAFEEVKAKEACDVIAIDVEGFFDTLDHELLKQSWLTLLGKDRLPADHYAIYKACTKDMAITLPTLRDIFGGEIRRRAGKDGAAICTPQDFRRLVKPSLCLRHDLVWQVKRKALPSHLNSKAAGIPQGLPISAVLANIYMFEADLKIKSQIENIGGSYRRYSDDILLIVPSESAKDAKLIIDAELAAVQLHVNHNKTMHCRFRASDGRLKAFSVDEHLQEQGLSPLSYLGFTFDGQDLRVRNSTVSGFMIKAKRAITRATIAAKNSESKHLKKRQLYARLTSLGYGDAYGKGVYEANAERILPKGAPRLGFFKYLQLAEKITGSDTISTQIRQIEGQVFREIHAAEKSLK